MGTIIPDLVFPRDFKTSESFDDAVNALQSPQLQGLAIVPGLSTKPVDLVVVQVEGHKPELYWREHGSHEPLKAAPAYLYQLKPNLIGNDSHVIESTKLILKADFASVDDTGSIFFDGKTDIIEFINEETQKKMLSSASVIYNVDNNSSVTKNTASDHAIINYTEAENSFMSRIEGYYVDANRDGHTDQLIIIHQRDGGMDTSHRFHTNSASKETFKRLENPLKYIKNREVDLNLLKSEHSGDDTSLSSMSLIQQDRLFLSEISQRGLDQPTTADRHIIHILKQTDINGPDYRFRVELNEDQAKFAGTSISHALGMDQAFLQADAIVKARQGVPLKELTLHTHGVGEYEMIATVQILFEKGLIGKDTKLIFDSCENVATCKQERAASWIAQEFGLHVYASSQIEFSSDLSYGDNVEFRAYYYEREVSRSLGRPFDVSPPKGWTEPQPNFIDMMYFAPDGSPPVGVKNPYLHTPVLLSSKK
jgi:hypothetical protein